MGSVVPLELSFSGLTASEIAIVFGITTLMELGRIVFAQLIDLKGIKYSIHTFIGGFLLLFLGVGVLSLHNFSQITLIFLALLGATLGSALVTMVLDGTLAKASVNEDKSIALLLQSGRLLGFAVGGIFIALTYGQWGPQFIFKSVFIVILVAAIIGSISIYRNALILDKKEKSETKIIYELHAMQKTHSHQNNPLIATLKNKELLIFFLFFSLYGIGLFAQDSILEVYGKEVFGYGRSEIGKITGIWGTTTLFGVLCGGFLMRKYSDKFLVTINSLVASIGIGIVGLTSILPVFQNFIILSLGVSLLGIGSGAASTPAISRLVYYTRKNPESLTIMGIFGVLATLLRASGAFLAAIVIELRSFGTLFLLESLFFLLAIVPYLKTQNISTMHLKSNLQTIADV